MVEVLSVLIIERRLWAPSHKMDGTRHYDANAEQYGYQSLGGAC